MFELLKGFQIMNLHLKNNLETWLYISLCFFALGFDVSLAIGNTGLGLAIALGIACAIKKRDSLQPLQRIDSGLIKVIAIFFIITMLSWLAGGEFSSKGISNITNQVVFRFAPFLLLPIAIKNKQQLIGFTAVLLVSFFINNSYLIWQGMEAAEALGVARPGGFMNYMYQGGLLCMIVSSLPILWLAAKRNDYKGILLVSWLVAVVASVFNSTRGGWLASAITLPLVMLSITRNKKKMLAGIMVSFCLLGALVAYSPSLHSRVDSIADTQSNSERFLMWQSAWNMFQDYPVLGIGVGNYTRAYQTQYILPEAKERELTHAHSNIMHLLAERGALGGGSFMLMWGYFLWFSLKGWHKSGHYAYACFFAVVCSFTLQGLTEYNLGSALTSKFLWLTMAMLLRWLDLDGL